MPLGIKLILVALVFLGSYIGFHVSLYIQLAMFVLTVILFYSANDEIVQIIILVITIPIGIGLLMGDISYYYEIYRHVSGVLDGNVTVGATDTNQTSMSFWEWLNSKPFAEYAEKN